MAVVFLGLGSNMGDRELQLLAVLDKLAPDVIVRGVSSLYETDPVGYLEQGAFLNAVAEGETLLEPRVLLNGLKEIERDLGRQPSFRNGPRVVDIDILSYERKIVDEPDLQIPHPRLTERAFVIVPLSEIAPQWRHPASNRSSRELLATLQPVIGVRLFKKNWWGS